MKRLFIRVVNVRFVKVTFEHNKDTKITEWNNMLFSLKLLQETRGG